MTAEIVAAVLIVIAYGVSAGFITAMWTTKPPASRIGLVVSIALTLAVIVVWSLALTRLIGLAFVAGAPPVRP